jgi:nucleoside-diphosphate-sugar epimerase
MEMPIAVPTYGEAPSAATAESAAKSAVLGVLVTVVADVCGDSAADRAPAQPGGAHPSAYVGRRHLHRGAPDAPHARSTGVGVSRSRSGLLADEAIAAAFTHVYGLETVCLRYFNVFGPRQDPKSQYAAVIPLFISAMARGERPTIFGDGEQSRDFTYVANVVDANLKAATAAGGPGGAFNIACGEAASLNELVGILNELLGTNIDPIYAEERTGDVKRSLADITAARDAFGYEPLVRFREGLERAVEWYAG